eukprot:5257928-Amphidinium_carterae.1
MDLWSARLLPVLMQGLAGVVEAAQACRATAKWCCMAFSIDSSRVQKFPCAPSAKNLLFSCRCCCFGTFHDVLLGLTTFSLIMLSGKGCPKSCDASSQGHLTNRQWHTWRTSPAAGWLGSAR